MRALETGETSKPWIVYRYTRPDWLAMILGGVVEAECCVCGRVKTLHLGWWALWFPKWSQKRPGEYHPKRQQFIDEHLHPTLAQLQILWARPLRNPAAFWRLHQRK